MEQQPQTYRFMWQSIDNEATYTPRKWSIIAHLEIRSIAPDRAPLPITRTGYLSHFHECGTIEARGGDVVAQVTAWLDEEAANPNGRRKWHTANRADCSDVSDGNLRVSRRRETQANPQIILHNSYTGKYRDILSRYINGLYESEDLERVKGIEPSS